MQEQTKLQTSHLLIHGIMKFLKFVNRIFLFSITLYSYFFQFIMIAILILISFKNMSSAIGKIDVFLFSLCFIRLSKNMLKVRLVF